MIRALLPTDLAALLIFGGRLSPNQAIAREELSRGDRGRSWLGVFLTHWLPPGGQRHTLVWSSRGSIRGLVSARRRHGPRAWEIDHLLLSNQETDICSSLLDKVSVAAAHLGGEKLFLRLPQESPLLDSARGVGFSTYLREHLYLFTASGEGAPTPSIHLHPRLPSDELGLFQLYSAAAPGSVRSMEGLTLSDWREARERAPLREMVYEHEGRLLAWLGIGGTREVGQFGMMVHPEAEDRTEELIDYSMSVLRDRSTLLCLVPEFQVRLQRLLEVRGFDQTGSYSILVRQLRARVPQAELAPIPAQGWGPALPIGGMHAQRNHS